MIELFGRANVVADWVLLFVTETLVWPVGVFPPESVKLLEAEVERSTVTVEPDTIYADVTSVTTEPLDVAVTVG